MGLPLQEYSTYGCLTRRKELHAMLVGPGVADERSKHMAPCSGVCIFLLHLTVQRLSPQFHSEVVSDLVPKCEVVAFLLWTSKP